MSPDAFPSARYVRQSDWAAFVSLMLGNRAAPVATALVAGVVGKLLMILIALPVYAVFGPDAYDGYTGRVRNWDGTALFLALVIAPLTESLVVRAGVWLLGTKLRLRPAAVVWLPALLFVPLHGLVGGSWIVLPMFTLHAAVQKNWLNRGRGWTGYWIIAAAHAITNGTTFAAASVI